MLEELLPVFLLMKNQGQHVRLEWMPEAAYGNVPKSNAEADHSEAELRERHNFYGDDAQRETESNAMKLGFGYV